MTITRDMYRLALHVYLIHAYPDDDMQYYSKWAWMVSPRNDFWKRAYHSRDEPKDFNFPREVRFGCDISGNTKLRCYPSGFMFDMNAVGDSKPIVDLLKILKKKIEDDWEKYGLPVCGRDSSERQVETKV